jgi:hypothetical protein
MHTQSTDLALTVMLVAAIAAVLGLLGWSIAEARRRCTAIPLLALAGGVVALPIEPFWDVNVQFAFAANSHPIAFTAFERAIPLYLAFMYPAFIGWGSYLGYRMIKQGATRGQLLLLPAAFCAADAVIEIAGIKADLWSYYGAHAWNPADWPIYFGVLNGAIALTGGWLLARAESRVPRPALALAVPTAYVGIYAVAGWPTWAALNANVPAVVVWAAGAATIAIAAGICRVLATEAGAPSRAVAPVPTSQPRAASRELVGSL